LRAKDYIKVRHKDLYNFCKKTLQAGIPMSSFIQWRERSGIWSFKNIFIYLCLFLSSNNTLFGQTDKEFWFVVPKVTTEFGPGGPALGLNITTYSLTAHVTIAMPANGAFTPIVITIPANSIQQVDLSGQIAQVENGFAALSGIQGKNNKGLHITSDNLIGVTFESKRAQNPEIFSLKGSAALGSDFYTSFQTRMYNYSLPTFVSPPYSSFDIVFAENNTFITMVIPAGKSIYNGINPPLTGTVVLGPFNKGETYTGIPAMVTVPEVTGFYANDVAFGRAAEDHLAGVHITSAGKKIAITLKDDALKSLVGNCVDLIGDQTIPVTQLGTEYIAIKGSGLYGSQNSSFYIPPPADPVGTETLYILATSNGTPITIDGVLVATLNAGQTYVFDMVNPVSVVSTTGSPFYCMQISGVGCDMGDDILPPTNACTGSSQVSFTRSTSQEFYLNIIVRKDAKDGFLVNGSVMNYLDQSNFTDIYGTNWAYGRIGPLNTAQVQVGPSYLLSNTKDLFHVGIMNASSTPGNPPASTGGARFGMLSGFRTIQQQKSGFISETGSQYAHICNGKSVHFVAQGGVNYSWSPPDYLSDQYSSTPLATPPSNTTYVVTVSGACGYTDTINFKVDVALPIKARFNIDTSFGCAPIYLKIEDQSYGASTYNWNFGDGNTAVWASSETKTDDTSFLHHYTNPTRPFVDRTIRLIVSNSIQCKDTLQRNVRIYPQVTASFNQAPDTIGCHPFSVGFINSSLNADIYQWQFGDGSSSALQNPNHSFSDMGTVDSTYQARLVSTSVYFCSDTVYRNFIVHPFLNADFTETPSSGCSPLTINIINKSNGGSSITNYQWDFGDGNTSNSSAANIAHTYINATNAVQKRSIRLIVTNVQGCHDTLTRIIDVYPKVTAQFTEDNTIGCNPLKVQFTRPNNIVPVLYNWSFGDGSSSSISDPQHIFANQTARDTTYTTTLIVTSQYSCADTFQKNVSIYRYIKSDFAVDKAEGCKEFDVTILNNSLSFAGIKNFDWDYGDGTNSTSTAASQNHHYINNTSTTVLDIIKLVVSNIHGCSDSMSIPISIYPKVIAGFSADVNSGCNPLSVNFTNSSNQPVAKNFNWIFGDGGSDSLVNSNHLFANHTSRDTSFVVHLIAVSDKFCSDTSQLQINVYSMIKADFEIDPQAGCSPFAMSVNNHSSGGINQYSWDFGDGSPLLSLAEPSHRYLNQSLSNNYRNIVLIVKNSHACSDSTKHQITVYPEVVPAFQSDVQQGCNPLTINITNHSNAVATEYNWDFGDSTSSAQINPSHTFINLGSADSTHTVRLHAVSTYGCSHDTSLDIITFAYIDADFKVLRADICSNTDLLIKNTSLGGIKQSFWDFENDGIIDLLSNDTAMSHQYTNLSSTYETKQLKLLVKNNHACYDSMIREMTIYPRISAQFNLDSAGCHPFTVQLNNTTQAGLSNLGANGNYLWNFGDGLRSTVISPEKIYYNYNDHDTAYTIKLVVESQFNCRDSISKIIHVFHKPRALFAIDRTIDCPPFNLQILNQSVTSHATFYWNYGDGTADTLLNKGSSDHTYINQGASIVSYKLKLNVVTDHGCQDSTALTVSAYPGVVAKFSYDSAGCSPLTSNFVNQSVNAFYYSWDFSDGHPSFLKDLSHIFQNLDSTDRIFNVKLISTSLYNCKDSVVHPVYTYAQPIAIFIPTPPVQFYAPGAKVTITNYTNHLDAWQYNWNFGDGTNSTTNQMVFDKFYGHWASNDSGNIYIISLLATNKNHPQCWDTISDPIRVFAPTPFIEFTNTDTSGCEPLTVSFSVIYNYAYTDSFYWDFDDGQTSTDINPVHTYAKSGVYNARLRVSGDGGRNYGYQIITANPGPTADFDVAPRVVMLPSDHIELINKSNLDSAWYWDFGDGNSSIEHQPQHVYKDTGLYNITLIVESKNHCKDTVIKAKIVEVVNAGIIDFPNAFTPNISGPLDGTYDNLSMKDLNKIFYPHHSGVDQYLLEVYNRWGELMFRSEKVEIGWNGYFNGNLCKQDVYVWKVKGIFVNGRAFIKAGDVTLLIKKD
jgi:gliding motility-associated-like protein